VSSITLPVRNTARALRSPAVCWRPAGVPPYRSPALPRVTPPGPEPDGRKSSRMGVKTSTSSVAATGRTSVSAAAGVSVRLYY
jgi:hypothetical protein